MYIYVWYISQKNTQCAAMGWLRSVGSTIFKVSLAEYCLFCRALLQKRRIILSILLIVAIDDRFLCAYVCVCVCLCGSIYLCIYTYILINIYYIYMHTHTHTYTHTYVYIYMYIYININIYAYM